MRLIAFVLLLTSVFATKNVTHGLLRERSMNTTNRQLDLKGDILKKLIASMTSSECAKATRMCYAQDCMGCSNLFENDDTQEQDLPLSSSDDPLPDPGMRFLQDTEYSIYGQNYTCEEIFDATREHLGCTMDGNVTAFCDLMDACYGIMD